MVKRTGKQLQLKCIKTPPSAYQHLLKLPKFDLQSETFNLIRFFSVFLSPSTLFCGWQKCFHQQIKNISLNHIHHLTNPSYLSIHQITDCQPGMFFFYFDFLYVLLWINLSRGFYLWWIRDNSQGTNQHWIARTIHPGGWRFAEYDGIQATHVTVITVAPEWIANPNPRSNCQGKFSSSLFFPWQIIIIFKHLPHCKVE